MWNFNIAEAPHEGEVWLATKCGKVIKSYWVEQKGGAGRWCMLGTKETPIAWQLHVTPLHPDMEFE